MLVQRCWLRTPALTKGFPSLSPGGPASAPGLFLRGTTPSALRLFSQRPINPSFPQQVRGARPVER